MASASKKQKSGSIKASFAGAGSNSEAQPICCRSIAPAQSPPPNAAKASPSASSAKTQSPSITTPLRMASNPNAPSSAIACGSPSSQTPTVTNSTSKAPPTHPKNPSTRTQNDLNSQLSSNSFAQAGQIFLQVVARKEPVRIRPTSRKTP